MPVLPRGWLRIPDGVAGCGLPLLSKAKGGRYNSTVPREKVLALLRQHWAEIQTRFGVERLMLFGSTARG
jgi:hypothetical protein